MISVVIVNALLNPDCIVRPDTFARVVREIEANPEVGMAGCLIRNPDGTDMSRYLSLTIDVAHSVGCANTFRHVRDLL